MSCSATVHAVEGGPEVPQNNHGRHRETGCHGNPRDAWQDAAKRGSANSAGRRDAGQHPHLCQECPATPSELMATATCDDMYN